jgi:hypothetical protein
MKEKARIIFNIVVYIFAAIGLVFTVVFFGMQYGLFNVKGSIADRNAFFKQQNQTQNPITIATPPCVDSNPSCDWNKTPEWNVVKGGLEKDSAIIQRVTIETGVPARMIASVVVPEQTRFFTANREVFKRYFEPLKILGSLSQFSLGVSGIKQNTAVAIENNLIDPNSVFYPGVDLARLVTYADPTKHDAELYNRLTDAKDHYYQYLYTALYIKEIEQQWNTAGFPIDQNPGVIVTLFNLGFQASHPNATPAVGGSIITTGGNTITYGELGEKFYASDELRDIFPQ